jgi:hypothetical protein
MAEQLTTTDADATYEAKVAQFEREVAAYDALWPELLKTHKGKWVAIHQGQLVDDDDDERALHERVRAKYGYGEPVLVTQVLETRHRIVDIPGIDVD